jgi:glycosyltransferase involved in cell wall biosynthesis
MYENSMKSQQPSSTSKQVSLIVTVLNEAATIEALLQSVLAQTRVPDEVVIVDGGSSDETVAKSRAFARTHSELKIVILKEVGNRSVGRNAAIRAANFSLIAITDAGCVLEASWLAELLAVYASQNVPVVSGYYRAEPSTPLQEAVVPYVLVMPDVVNPRTFLPATRSMLLEKAAWARAGGFDEALSDNEDYAFAKRLEHLQVARAFARDAVVIWQPVHTLPQFFKMLYRFAKGDVFSGIVRPKVLLVFARYGAALLLAVAALTQPQLTISLVTTLVFCAVLYVLWSIRKNYRYAKNGWYWLPVLQLLADAAVLSGSLAGVFQRRNLGKAK